MTRRYLFRVLVWLCVAPALLAGCDGEGRPGEPDRYGARFEPLPGSVRGGELRVLDSGELGSLDPGQAIYQPSSMIAFATQRTLLATSPHSSSTLVPDLAERMPETAPGRGELKLTIRDGIRFSPPYDREVRADDIKYAIERALLPGVANGEVETYLGTLVGFARARQMARGNPREAPEIAGITCPTDDQIVFRFRGEVPPLAEAVLTLPVTAPVPREFARALDREIPSRYGNRVLATGPYMVARSDSGELTGAEPGGTITLVRNPNWDPETDFRPAYLDEIRVESGYANAQAASEQILAGESMVNGDFAPPPFVLQKAAMEHPGQLTIAPSKATIYSSLNTRVPPFDDPDVRRAVIAATDRHAMMLAAGGEFAGEVATHFLPPGIEGFEQAGGFEGPAFDFLAEPEGDVELAARYMRRAGHPTGRYEGDARPVMVTATTTRGRRFAEILRQALASIGIGVDLITVSRDTMYSSWCNVPAKRVGVCADVGWVGQFGDGETILNPTFNGAAIVPVNNSNWPLLDDPVTNRAIEYARRGVGRQERATRWARADRLITALAPAVPALWVNITHVVSPNVNLVLERSAMTPALPMISLDEG